MRNTLTDGDKVRVYEPGDGIRRRYYEMLEPTRFLYPRGLKKTSRKPYSWYLDGHLSSRPTMGIYAMARFAEALLFNVKAKRRGWDHTKLREATEFFAATRRAMVNVLASGRVTRRPTRKVTAYAAKVLEKLYPLARKTVAELRLTPTTAI